jgi:hypothetical protein
MTKNDRKNKVPVWVLWDSAESRIIAQGTYKQVQQAARRELFPSVAREYMGTREVRFPGRVK